MKCIFFIQQIFGYDILGTCEAKMKEAEAFLVLKKLTIWGIQTLNKNNKYYMEGAYTWGANLS